MERRERERERDVYVGVETRLHVEKGELEIHLLQPNQVVFETKVLLQGER